MTSRERILNEKDPEVLRFYIDRILKEKNRQDQVISDYLAACVKRRKRI